MIGNGARSDTSFASRIACQKAAGMTATSRQRLQQSGPDGWNLESPPPRPG
jgi:hypothetical protein